MKYLKLFENFPTIESPDKITVRFNGNGFMDHYWTGEDVPGYARRNKTYQAEGMLSNLDNLYTQGHQNYGVGGLEMTKGYYYPLFAVMNADAVKHGHDKDMKYLYWIYIVYDGDEINIVRSSEHSDQGTKIPHEFRSLKDIQANWYCKFDKGVAPGAIDHRKFFEIVSVK